MKHTPLLIAILISVATVTLFFVVMDKEEDNTGMQSSDTPERSADTWEVYRAEDLSFALELPPTAEVSREEGNLKVQVIHPTAPKDTEVQDGLTLYVEVQALDQGVTLEALARERYEEETERLQVIEGVTETTFGSDRAYSFTLRSELGSPSTYVYRAGDEGSVFVIFYTIADPHQRGYAGMVERMIATLKVLAS